MAAAHRKARVFVSDADGYLGTAVAAAFKRGMPGATIVGSSRVPGAKIVTGSPAAVSAALEADIIVLSLTTALLEAQAVVEAMREFVAALPPLEKAGDGEGGDGGDGGGDGDGGDGDGRPASQSKTVVALSTTLAWDRTTSMPQPWEEAAFKRRRPGMKGAEVRDTEIAITALSRPDRGVRCHVIGAGTPYGGGSGPLYPLLRRAWLCVDAAAGVAATGATAPLPAAALAAAAAAVGLPVPCARDDRGRNKVPTVHVRDLATFTVRVAAASPELQGEAGVGEYFLAVDEGADTLVDIVAAISRTLGAGGTRLLPKDDVPAFFASPDEPVTIRPSTTPAPAGGAGTTANAGATASAGASASGGSGDGGSSPLGHDSTLVATAAMHVSQSATFDVSTAAMFADARVALADDAWHCRGGIVAHIATVADEFRRALDLRPIRLAVTGPPLVGKTRIASALAVKYSLPLVTAKSAVAAVRYGNLRALGDGSAERAAALAALRDAVEKVVVDADAAAAAAAAAAEKGKKKDTKKAGAKEDAEPPAPAADRGFRLPHALLARVLRAVLLSPECRNKGWVLDGVPRTWAEADALFEALGDDDDGVTPADTDGAATEAATALREDAEDDAAVVAEAAAKHIVVTALGASVTAEPRKSSTASAAGGSGDGGDGGDGDGGDGEVEVEAPPKKEAEARLRPTAVVVLDAADAWLEARALAVAAGAAAGDGGAGAGGAARDRFLRRLKRYRLHSHPALARTALAWLEGNAGTEACELRVDAVATALAGGSGAAAGAAHGSHHAAGDDVLVGAGGVPAAVAAARAARDKDDDDDARTAALLARLAAAGPLPPALPSPYVGLPDDALVPADLPPALASTAALDLAVLHYAATYAQRGGRPANFRPLPAEAAALASVLAARAARRGRAAAAAHSAVVAEESRTRAAAADVEAEHAAAAARAEAALLEARTAPLRAYLLANVVPHITAGLIEVCKAGPVDPVDCLADYLFKVATAQETEARSAAHAAAAPAAGVGASPARRR